MSTRVVSIETGETIGYARVRAAGDGLEVRLLDGHEIPENEIEHYFGLVDWDPISFLDGVGCYRKIRAFHIRAWRARA